MGPALYFIIKRHVISSYYNNASVSLILGKLQLSDHILMLVCPTSLPFIFRFNFSAPQTNPLHLGSISTKVGQLKEPKRSHYYHYSPGARFSTGPSLFGLVPAPLQNKTLTFAFTPVPHCPQLKLTHYTSCSFTMEMILTDPAITTTEPPRTLSAHINTKVRLENNISRYDYRLQTTKLSALPKFLKVLTDNPVFSTLVGVTRFHPGPASPLLHLPTDLLAYGAQQDQHPQPPTLSYQHGLCLPPSPHVLQLLPVSYFFGLSVKANLRLYVQS